MLLMEFLTSIIDSSLVQGGLGEFTLQPTTKALKPELVSIA